MNFVFRRIEGTVGSVVIPNIGLTIGTFGSWTLQRREDAHPGAGEWDLHAVFSYVNDYAWSSTGWDKEIRITFGHPKTGQQYRLDIAENGRTVLEGKSLLIEGANLCPLR